MATWQLAILLLALVWALQSAGVWMQMRHYREALGDIEQRFNTGFVGTGFMRGRLAKGTIALVVISDQLVVERVALMTGRSVFAKFQTRREFDGLTLQALRGIATAQSKEKSTKSLGEALLKAIEQIDAVRARKQQMEQAKSLPNAQRGDDGIADDGIAAVPLSIVTV